METSPETTPPILPSSMSIVTAAPAYEAELTRNWNWAMDEGDRHFDEKSRVFEAMRKIAGRLDELGIAYAVVGGMAVYKHGLRRFTEDVDLLVTPEDLKIIHDRLDGLGYLRMHAKGKHLRDTQLGVRIEFLTTGGFPGDGKPKPVEFPNPKDVSVTIEGVNYINLPTLIELKLASGISQPDRLKDLSDVQELIKTLHLKAELSDSLNPYVRSEYLKLWQQTRIRFVTTWRNKWLTAKSTSIEEMVQGLREAARTLEEMKRDGVILEKTEGSEEDYALLVTTDPEIARKYNMINEIDFWDEQEAAHD